MAKEMYRARDYKIFVGIDVDKKSYAITAKDKDMMSRRKKIPAEPEQLYNYLKKGYGGKRVLYAYEAGPTGYELHDYLRGKGEVCLVVSPLTIPKASNQRVKNNRIDSEKIANHLRSGELKPIRVPYGNYRELRHLTEERENYAYLRKATKQRIKSLLLYTGRYREMGEERQQWSRRHIQQLKELKCTEAERHRLDMLLQDLDYARGQMLVVLRKMREYLRRHEEIRENVEYLISIPGIGIITAMTVLGRIGDPKTLQDVREISAFVGLVPREKSTGDVVNQGPITHTGNRTLRSLLIEASWTAIRKDTELKQFFDRIRKRHHPKVASRKAIVAVARKLTQRIYRVLKDRRKYIVH